MNMRKWWPYWTIGVAAVIVSVAYPMYFRYWDHRSCVDSGGQWNQAERACIEPRNADIPDTWGRRRWRTTTRTAEATRQ